MSNYERALRKHYLLSQLFRHFGWLCALDLARKNKGVKGAEVELKFVNVDLRKEASGIKFRTSQKYWPVRDLEEVNINGISCLKFR